MKKAELVEGVEYALGNTQSRFSRETRYRGRVVELSGERECPGRFGSRSTVTRRGIVVEFADAQERSGGLSFLPHSQATLQPNVFVFTAATAFDMPWSQWEPIRDAARDRKAAQESERERALAVLREATDKLPAFGLKTIHTRTSERPPVAVLNGDDLLQLVTRGNPVEAVRAFWSAYVSAGPFLEEDEAYEFVDSYVEGLQARTAMTRAEEREAGAVFDGGAF